MSSSAERTGLLSCVVVAVLLASASAALAEGTVEEVRDQGGAGIEVTQPRPGDTPAPPPTSTPAGPVEPVCVLVTSFDLTDVYRGGTDGMALAASYPEDPEEGAVYAPAVMRDTCTGDPSGVPFYARVPEPGDGVDPVGEALARALAVVRPDPPSVQLRPEGRVLAGLAAWLWVDQPWMEITATDAADGLTVSVRYAVSWTLNGGPRQELADLTVSSDVPVTVGEVRAVRTR